MMINWFKAILIFTVVLFACKDSAIIEESASSACSEIIEGSEGLLLRNSYYLNGDNGIIQVNSEENLGTTDVFKSFDLQGLESNDLSNPKWQISNQASNFEQKNDFIIFESLAEDKEACYEMYNTLSGDLVLEYTYDRMEVLFSSDSEKRLLGFYSKKSAKESENFDFDKMVIGYFSYAHLSGLTQSVRINLKDESLLDVLDFSNPVVELMSLKQDAIELNGGKTLYYTGLDGTESNLINLDIKITFYSLDTYEPTSFLLQVRNDDLIVDEEGDTELFLISMHE